MINPAQSEEDFKMVLITWLREFHLRYLFIDEKLITPLLKNLFIVNPGEMR